MLSYGLRHSGLHPWNKAPQETRIPARPLDSNGGGQTIRLYSASNPNATSLEPAAGESAGNLYGAALNSYGYSGGTV
jgi:hypothetical protein